jgi:hypothetical protein
MSNILGAIVRTIWHPETAVLEPRSLWNIGSRKTTNRLILRRFQHRAPEKFVDEGAKKHIKARIDVADLIYWCEAHFGPRPISLR